jgi:hypothetical protein
MNPQPQFVAGERTTGRSSRRLILAGLKDCRWSLRSGTQSDPSISTNYMRTIHDQLARAVQDGNGGRCLVMIILGL